MQLDLFQPPKLLVEPEPSVSLRIQSPLEGVHFLKFLALECQEVLAACFLTSQHDVIATQEVFRGTLRSLNASPREILRLALQLNAGAVLIGHNHPSNDVKPSTEDVKFTQRFSKACRIMGVQFVDHLVLGKITADGKTRIFPLPFYSIGLKQELKTEVWI